MRKNETQETGTVLALTTALMNMLILVIIGGMFWLVQFIFAQINQINFVFQNSILS